MKRILFSFLLMLSCTFMFSQAQGITVYNNSNTTLFIWASAVPACGAIGAIASIPIPVAAGQPIFIPPVAPAGYIWQGFKAVQNLATPFLGPWGRFCSPCAGCCVTQSNGLTAQWNVFGGCFEARVN